MNGQLIILNLIFFYSSILPDRTVCVNTVPIRGHRYVISFCPRLTVKLYMSNTLHDDRAMSEPTLKDLSLRRSLLNTSNIHFAMNITYSDFYITITITITIIIIVVVVVVNIVVVLHHLLPCLLFCRCW